MMETEDTVAPTVDPEVRAHVYSLVSAVGQSTFEAECN